MGGKVLLIGRVVFSFFFIYSGFNHLTKLSMYSQFAGASGVPAPTLLTALSGLMLLAGGLSILLGVKAQWGSLLIAAFLIPAAFTVHKFWGIADPMMAAKHARVDDLGPFRRGRRPRMRPVPPMRCRIRVRVDVCFV